MSRPKSKQKNVDREILIDNNNKSINDHYPMTTKHRRTKSLKITEKDDINFDILNQRTFDFENKNNQTFNDT